MKNKINKIIVFDFDGTLMNTPVPSIGKEIWKKKTNTDWPHRGWWGQADSLDTDVFDIRPNKSVLRAYNKAVNDEHTLTILLSGRLFKLADSVNKILSDNNLEFDDVILNTGGDTLKFKIAELNKLLKKYPKVTEFEIYEDRTEHIPTFQKWCSDKKEEVKLEKYSVHLVDENDNRLNERLLIGKIFTDIINENI